MGIKYDSAKMIYCETATVAGIQELLERLPKDAKVVVNSTHNFYIHVAKDDSIVNIDISPMQSDYEES